MLRMQVPYFFESTSMMCYLNIHFAVSKSDYGLFMNGSLLRPIIKRGGKTNKDKKHGDHFVLLSFIFYITIYWVYMLLIYIRHPSNICSPLNTQTATQVPARLLYVC